MQDVHQSYRQGRDDAPPAQVATTTTAATDKKAAPTSGGGLLRAQLELFAKGMDPVQGCNTPYLVGDSEPCYIASFSPKLIANDLDRLIAKLPPWDAPAEQPTRRLPRGSIRQLRPEELAAMITDYTAGATIKELAATYHYGHVGVSSALKKAGVRLRRSSLTEEQTDEAERLYATGQSLATAAARFEVDAGTVRTRLIKRGVVMRPPSQRD